MTDLAPMPASSAEVHETVGSEALRVLRTAQERHPAMWLTAGEVHKVCPRAPMLALRRALREMAEAGTIETRVSGSPDRPLREYRARG